MLHIFLLCFCYDASYFYCVYVTYYYCYANIIYNDIYDVSDDDDYDYDYDDNASAI